MTQTVTVSRILDAQTAEISIVRPGACGKNCAACGGLCAPGAPLVARARNPVGAHPGDRVVVETSSKEVVGLAALVYLLPVVLFFAGYAAGGALWGGIAFFACLGGVVFWGRRRRESLPIIVEICSDT